MSMKTMGKIKCGHMQWSLSPFFSKKCGHVIHGQKCLNDANDASKKRNEKQMHTPNNCHANFVFILDTCFICSCVMHFLPLESHDSFLKGKKSTRIIDTVLFQEFLS